MARRFALVLLFIIGCASFGALPTAHASAPWSGLTDYTIRVGGYQRTYHVHLPPTYTSATPLPLVVGLHASHDSGQGMAGYTQFNDVADANNVIAVYPDALNGTWNGDGSAPQNDFAFISAVIQAVSAMDRVNSHRVYAMGFSNGAGMTEELGCRLSSQLAAIASVSGHLASTFPCAPTHPMPYLTFHGTADTIWSYDGYASAKYGNHLMGAIDAEDAWAATNHCTGKPVVSDLSNVVPSDGTKEQLRVIGNCAAGLHMELYTIVNGGHTWPGGMPLPYGLTTEDIHASNIIWQFFSQYQN